jgi:hypothetical protein
MWYNWDEPDEETTTTDELVYELGEALEWALEYILEVAGEKAKKEPMYDTGRLLLAKLGSVE